MKPEKLNKNLDMQHLRQLVDDIGLAQNEIARVLEVPKREFRAYLSNPQNASYRQMPYVVYYALSVWAAYCRYERKIANNSLSE